MMNELSRNDCEFGLLAIRLGFIGTNDIRRVLNKKDGLGSETMESYLMSKRLIKETQVKFVNKMLEEVISTELQIQEEKQKKETKAKAKTEAKNTCQGKKECPIISECELQKLEKVSEIARHNYCKNAYTKCARYALHNKYGPDAVPPRMLPNDRGQQRRVEKNVKKDVISLFGTLMIRLNIATKEDILNALDIQQLQKERGEKVMLMGEVLIMNKVTDEQQVDKILRLQSIIKQIRSSGEAMLNNGTITVEQMKKALTLGGFEDEILIEERLPLG